MATNQTNEEMQRLNLQENSPIDDINLSNTQLTTNNTHQQSLQLPSSNTETNNSHPQETTYFNESSSENTFVDYKYLFEKKLNETYNHQFVKIISSIFIITNLIIFYLEVSYSIKLANERYNSYNSLFVSKYIAYTALANMIYASIAFLTMKYRKYFLIQLATLLHFVGFIASAYYFVFINTILLGIQLFDSTCSTFCFTLQLFKLMLGVVSSILAFIFFVYMQFKFISNLNKCSLALDVNNRRLE